MRMGLQKENYVSGERPKSTAFDDFVVNFIVAFSGVVLLAISDLF